MGWNSQGPTTTTVVNTPAPPTAAQTEAENLRLAELRRQNDLAEALLPNQRALIDQQRLLIEYQMNNRGRTDALQDQQLELARVQLQNQIRDAAMQEQLQPLQLQFLQSQNQLAIEQLSALSETTTYQREANKYTLEQMRDASTRLQARHAAYSPEEEAQAAAEEARRGARMGAMSEEFAKIQLEAAQRGTKPTDEQLASINQAVDSAQASGESDINRFLKDTLRQINEETAQAAGLRSTDAPVVRLSERAGEEAGRAQGDLTSKMAETRARAMLDYPLAANKLQSDIAASGGALAANASNFQSELRMNAANNRNTAFNMPSSVGFAMPQGGASPSLGFMNPASLQTNPNAFQYSFGNWGPSTSTQTGTPGRTSFIQDVNAFSGAFQGFGNALLGGSPSQFLGAAGQGMGAGAALFSDRRLKTDIKKVGELDSGLPIYRYRYKGDNVTRVGVMAQETARLFPDAVKKHRSGFLAVDYSKVH